MECRKSIWQTAPGPAKYTRLEDQPARERSTELLPRGVSRNLDKLKADPVRFLEEFFHSGNEMDERLDLEELEKARDRLLKVLVQGSRGTHGLSEELTAIIIYKGRPLRAQLLHFAVWVSAQLRESSCVARLLPHLTPEEFAAKAKYRLKPSSQDETWLDAIHIAAGLGALPVMELLLKHVIKLGGSRIEYVNMPCIVHHSEVEAWNEDFYTPLHDAANAGNVEVSLWLLAHKADAHTPNKDGLTALHLVAMRGVNGLEKRGQVSNLLQALLRQCASLDGCVPETYPDETIRGRTPLELAALDRSRFPKNLMHLLAPCLNSDSSPFSDVFFLAKLNSDAAEQAKTQRNQAGTWALFGLPNSKAAQKRDRLYRF